MYTVDIRILKRQEFVRLIYPLPRLWSSTSGPGHSCWVSLLCFAAGMSDTTVIFSSNHYSGQVTRTQVALEITYWC